MPLQIAEVLWASDHAHYLAWRRCCPPVPDETAAAAAAAAAEAADPADSELTALSVHGGDGSNAPASASLSLWGNSMAGNADSAVASGESCGSPEEESLARCNHGSPNEGPTAEQLGESGLAISKAKQAGGAGGFRVRSPRLSGAEHTLTGDGAGQRQHARLDSVCSSTARGGSFVSPAETWLVSAAASWARELKEDDFKAAGPLVQQMQARLSLPPRLRQADQALRASLARVAAKVYLRSVLEPGDALHRHTEDFGAAMRLSSANSVLFSVRPIAAAATKRSFAVRQGVWFVVALAVVVWAIMDSDAIPGSGPLLRMRPLWLLDPARSANESSVVRFGPRIDGCRVPADFTAAADSSAISSGAHGAGGELMLNISRAGGQLSGYYFTISDGRMEGHDPVLWTVESSWDNGRTWAPLTACQWVTVWLEGTQGTGVSTPSSFIGAGGRFADCQDGSVDLRQDVSLRSPLPRRSEVHVDIRPDLSRKMEVPGTD